MIPMSISDIAKVTGSVLVNGDGVRSSVLRRVCTDTRTLERGELFIALKGAKHDAHDYLEQALDRGAAAVVVSRMPAGFARRAAEIKVAVLHTRNTLRALTRLAARQRELFTGVVVAVTGSTGKTLTKDFAAAVLGRMAPVTASRGSYNNEIGVPLTILDMDERTEYMVLEMGSRGMGHIKSLCDFARPDVGVITNIGNAHMRYFQSRENLALAKSELLQALPEEGWAVINADDDYAEFMQSRSPARVLTFGYSKGAQVRAEDIEVDQAGKVNFVLRSKGGEKAKIKVPLPGRHNVVNTLAAAAIGEIMGVDMKNIVEGIESAKLSRWRMEMIKKPEEITIINDAYNANPVSMRSALMALGDISTDKRAIAVLGDMQELGNISEKAHVEVGKLAVDYGTDILITVGRRARKIAQSARDQGLPRGSIFVADKVDKAADILRCIIEPGDVILIKGSRFLGLERLVDMVA
jgi:UDP-N-acetylmuramoyl-tripeptide--D-alanyl-D-alanine ligase